MSQKKINMSDEIIPQTEVESKDDSSMEDMTLIYSKKVKSTLDENNNKVAKELDDVYIVTEKVTMETVINLESKSSLRNIDK